MIINAAPGIPPAAARRAYHHIIMNNKLSLVAVASLTAIMASSCHIYKKFEMPQDEPLTREYTEARDAETDSAAFGNLAWQQVFTDPVLVDLINGALANNTNLDNARLNIEIAHANLRGARLSYLPSLTLAPQGGASSVANGKLTNWNYTIPLSASWEVDIFGKLLNSKRGAEAAYQQTKDYEQAVRSQIIGGVANCYYAISTLKSQLQLNRETAEIWRQNVQVMQDYKEAGMTNEAAVVQARANYIGILASITDLEASLTEAYNTLSLLMNEMPHEWAIPADAELTVPQILRDGVPMRELAARPDVRAAEMNLASAYYSTNLARAAFYPGLTISANYGFTNQLGSFISNPGEWFANLAGSLVAPLFSRGQNIARLQAAKAQQQQALNNFEYTLLNAAAEVSNNLSSLENSRKKAGHLTDKVDNLDKSVQYTSELFGAGSATYLEVLTAQSSLLAAQMEQLNCRLTQAQSLIALYQSLGGGR